jgi:hypothetical protein
MSASGRPSRAVASQGRRAAGVRAAALGLLLGACDTLEPIRNVNPELADVQAYIWPRVRGVMEVTATPANSSFRLPRRGRVEILIRSSGGDAESIALYRLWCPPHRTLSLYQCNALVLVTVPGVAVTDLEYRVVELGGRFTFVSTFNNAWAVVLFPSPNGLMARRQRLLDWPEVLGAGLDRPGCAVCDEEWINEVQAALSAAIPLEMGSPVVGDGTVQYAPGDTLALSYTNPGGSEIVRSGVMPAP